MRLLSSPGCFLACAIDGFLRFLAHGQDSLFCFLANRFSSLLCFLTSRLESVLNCFSCFLRIVLYVLNHAVLSERSERSRYDQSNNHTRNFHIPFLLLILS